MMEKSFKCYTHMFSLWGKCPFKKSVEIHSWKRILKSVVCYFDRGPVKHNLKDHDRLIYFPREIMDAVGIRNLKDFLLQYNKISESCFLNCVNHLSDRALSQDECGCVDMCTKKHISVNHKVMQVYLEIQPLLIEKRIQEVNKQQANLETAKKESEGNQQPGVATVDKPKVENVHEPKKLINTTPGSEHISDKGVVRTEYQ